MTTIPSEKIAEVRDRVDIDRVIGRTVQLKRQGRRLVGLCPFHREKSPSFSVDPEKKLYHCFGCGVGGDVFDFVMRIESLEFPEAVRLLAREAGVTLPEKEESPAEQRARDLKEQLFRVNALARAQFEALLWKNERALEYLRVERGLSDETIRRFHLGFAEDEWEGLAQILASKQVPVDLALRLGLVGRRQSGGVYDRFRGRVIFPIGVRGGQVAGFGARRSDWLASSEDEDRGPKYLNSPESPVYDKSSLFYGMDFALEDVRRRKRAVLVEGYFDVIALHQAGLSLAVACCGTALSEKHAASLARLCEEVTTLYDGDAAGIQATRRAAETLLSHGLSVRVLELPQGDDPDTFVRREGASELTNRLDAAPSAIEHFVRQAKAAHAHEGLAALVKTVAEVRPLIMQVKDPLARDLYIEGAAKLLEVPSTILRQHLGGQRTQPSRPKKPEQGAEATKPPPRVELAILKHLIEDPDGKLPVLEEKEAFEAFSDNAVGLVARGAYEAWKAGRPLDGQGALELLQQSELGNEARLRAIRETLVSQLPEEDDFNECLKRVLRGAIEARLRTLRRRIRATQDTDPETAARLTEELAAEMIRHKGSLS